MGSTTNLIGDPMQDIAIAQINARARLLSTTGLQSDATALAKVTFNNAYVKLSSFVNIEDAALAKALGVGKGSELSKKWTLMNGELFSGGSNGSYQNISIGGGVGADTGILHGYGQGGIGELGIKPMPGITGITITPAGTAGSIRQATVKFKCHNLRQLDIIDVLYFRFGFTMLLEWGHSMHINNQGIVQQEPSLIDIDQPGLSKEKIHQILAQKRHSSYGNYDGMLGYVVNYEWAASVDGGYDCTLKLSGIGGVIESLKINTNSNWPEGGYGATGGMGPISSGNTGNVLTNTTNYINSALNPAQQVASYYESTLSRILSKLKELILANNVGPTFQQAVKDEMASGLNLGNSPLGSIGYSKGFNAGFMTGRHPTVVDINFDKVYTCHLQSLQGPANSNSTAGNVDQAYIPLSLLLAIINNSSLAYESTATTNPLIYIDFNPDTNFCFRLPDQVSLDPRVCLIDSRDDGEEYRKWLAHRGVDTNALTPPADDTRVSGIMANLLGRVSGDVIASYVDSANTTRGHMMNILVNVDYILGLLTEISTSDQTNSVALSTFLDKLMKGIARVTGNINDFKVTYDDEANVVRIIDDQLVFNEASNKPYPTIQTFGLATGVRNLTFKTEASTKMGSMLAIDAQAGERTPPGDGTDSSAFSALNARLEDRVMHFKSREARPTAAVQAPSGLKEKASIFTEFRSNLYLNATLDPTGVDNNLNFYTECLNAYKSQKNKDLYGVDTVDRGSITARGILPLSINLTMNGLSTIKMREGFVIPVERLPSQYKDNKGFTRVGFVIAELTQTVQGQTWLTTIRGQMVNIPIQTTTPPKAITTAFRKAPGGGGGGSARVDTSKYIKNVYIPVLEKVHKDKPKGIRLLMTAQAQMEGYFPGSLSFRTNNPGNVRPGGSLKGFPTLEAGVQAQWDKVLGRAFAGKKSPYKTSYTLYKYLYTYAPPVPVILKNGKRNTNNPTAYTNFVIGYFKANGITITANTTLKEIAAIQ